MGIRMIKFWAFVYRLTGYYSPFARLAEYRHLKTQILVIEDRFTHPKNDMNLEAHVGLAIGLWQAKNGFARSFNHKKLFKKRYK